MFDIKNVKTLVKGEMRTVTGSQVTAGLQLSSYHRQSPPDPVGRSNSSSTSSHFSHCQFNVLLGADSVSEKYFAANHVYFHFSLTLVSVIFRISEEDVKYVIISLIYSNYILKCEVNVTIKSSNGFTF